MRRRLLPILTVVCVFLAGCAGIGVSGTGTQSTPTDDPATDAPAQTYSEDCRELVPQGMPERPANLTRQSAVSFAEAYTNFSYWNAELAGQRVRRVDVDTNGFVVTRTDTGYIIHVGRRVSRVGCDGTVADPSLYGAGYDYFINESVFAVNYTGRGVRNVTVHPPTTADEILRNGTTVERRNRTG